MRKASWKECLEGNFSYEITPDKEKARSLLETAEERTNFLTKEINENNINFVFEGYYSSILEILHAILSLEGYKVNNHVCLGYYLRDVLNKEDLFRAFDDCRFKRNSLIYYGNRMNPETAKHSLRKAKTLFTELKKIIRLKLD